MTTTFPVFTGLNLNTLPDQLAHLLDAQTHALARCLENPSFTWENLVEPMDAMDDELERFWSPISHLRGVKDSDELRTCFEKCLPLLSKHGAFFSRHEELYRALCAIDTEALDHVPQKILHDKKRDMMLSGVALEASDKKRLDDIDAALDLLSNRFENQVLDATQAFSLSVPDDSRLGGLPEYALHVALENAKKAKKTGYVLTLDAPQYIAVMTHANDRDLRKTLHEAYVTRASNKGPQQGQWDNTPVLTEILALREEKAHLLGFENYAAYSLTPKMAKNTDTVYTFLNQLKEHTKAPALKEIAALATFAKETLNLNTLEPWDIGYVSEKYRQKYCDFSEDVWRPYFPQSVVLEGFFALITRLYGIRLVEIDNIDVWDGDVQCFALLNGQDACVGYLYMDLFARANKRSGAWMDSAQTRRRMPSGQIQLPIAYLTCNFSRPDASGVATLSHDELITLFHEGGHCLHHLLTAVDYYSAAGIHGVEWDAVELPSQLLEQWAWDKETLKNLSRHTKTGEKLPDDIFESCLKTRHTLSAMAMRRQLEFALFDQAIHQNTPAESTDWVHQALAKIRQEVSVLPSIADNRFENSFSHIFAGGYAAGYYSYLWAEMLSSDVFARFEEEGIFNPEVSQDYLKCILSVGSTLPAMEAFMAFRKRAPSIDALLRHHGM